MKKAIFMTMIALGVTAFLFAQDASKFNGTWKGDGGQVRELVYKDGVVHMKEQNTNGLLILRDYPTQGQEITMKLEGFWNDAKATGKMEGNKLVVDTTQANGAKWHDEWTMAADGKTYEALRVSVAPATKGPGPGGPGGGAPGAVGPGGAKGPGGPPPAGGAPAGGGAAKGKGPGGPETFTKIQ